MRRKTNENRGITLIALVVTIIIVVLLAGITISMLIGKNGILNRAAEAKEKTGKAGDIEYLQIEVNGILTKYYMDGAKNIEENEYILIELGKKEEITTNVGKGTVKYKGKEYEISEIKGETKEKTEIKANKLEAITISNVAKGSEEEELLKSDQVRMIIKEQGEKESIAVIPTGFYYVTGTPSTGLVISDKAEDDDKNTKKGNQFVWIPCNGKSGVTYEKTDDNAEGNHGLASYWKEDGYNGKQHFYNTIPSGYTNAGQEIIDWEDNGGSYESVKKYGGFYVGRYEAGVPETAEFYASKDGDKYETNGKKNAEEVKELSPVSKKNNQAWNYISQENAKILSENMYKESVSVKSSLIDSYAWDTIVRWVAKDSQYSGIGLDSTNYGNYYNNTGITENTLYAMHLYRSVKSAGQNNSAYTATWTAATKYRKGNITSGHIPNILETDRNKYEWEESEYSGGTEYYNYTVYKELATGASEKNKVKNIYDMAGNMWEWTTETGKHTTASGTTATTYAVLRGGGFNNAGSANPVSFRNGNYTTRGYFFTIGFRAVLYIA